MKKRYGIILSMLMLTLLTLTNCSKDDININLQSTNINNPDGTGGDNSGGNNNNNGGDNNGGDNNGGGDSGTSKLKVYFRAGVVHSPQYTDFTATTSSTTSSSTYSNIGVGRYVNISAFNNDNITVQAKGYTSSTAGTLSPTDNTQISLSSGTYDIYAAGVNVPAGTAVPNFTFGSTGSATCSSLENGIDYIWASNPNFTPSTTNSESLNLLRYALLAATFFSAAFGYLSLCLLLDPYSNFGRIASNLFRPVVIWGNNLLADGLMRMDNYSLYHVTLKTITVSSLVAACIALAVFIGFTLWRGRLFCNSICPVGALLSLFSRFSWYRINLDESTCTHCGNCERSCKAEAIDSKSLTVDASRCVECFNCLSVCPKGSVQYLPRNKRTKAEETVVEKPLQLVKADQNSRRTFLATGATIAASLPVVSALAEVGDGHAKGHGKGHGHGKKSLDHALPIVPPGAGSIVRFTELCTGCQLCVTRCPSQVLRPAGLEYGFDYLLKPHMAYISSYCNYECTACAEICPNQAILPITKEEKITTQVGVAHFYKGRCVVNLEEQDCGACAEHCPTQAVHMIPFKGTLTIPSVDPDLCIGCGGCESICPVRPGRAIVIHANKVHQVVEKPEEEEVKEIEIDDFGF